MGSGKQAATDWRHNRLAAAALWVAAIGQRLDVSRIALRDATYWPNLKNEWRINEINNIEIKLRQKKPLIATNVALNTSLMMPQIVVGCTTSLK